MLGARGLSAVACGLALVVLVMAPAVVSTFLVQQIKLAEAMALGSSEHVRAPRMPLTGEHRTRVEGLIRERIACRPDLARFAKAA